MTNAKRDNNQITVVLGTSNADGTTPLPIYVDPTTHALDVSDGTTGSDLSGDDASRDDNGVTVWMAISETDEITPVQIYINSTDNKLLIDST